MKNWKYFITTTFCLAVIFFIAVSGAHAGDDLKFYWPLDEGEGGTTGALTGYPGTLYGGPTWILNGGLSFDGVDDYIRTDSPLTESMGVSNQAYTLSASVRVNDESESGNIIHISNSPNGGNGQGWCISMLHIQNGHFRAIGWDGTPVTAVNSVPAVLGEWYSIANTWSPETETLDLYVNGVQVASSAMTAYAAADDPVYVFAGIDAPSCSNNQGWFKGDVKDVRIYSRAITEEEAAENSNASLGTISATLSPVDNAEDVAISTNLVLSFSTSTVATSTGQISIYRAEDDSLFESFDIDSDRITIDGNEVTISPISEFEYGTEYLVVIPDTAFVDADDNTYPGISGSSWSFTTIEEPIEEDFGDDNDIPEGSIYEMLEQHLEGFENHIWTSISVSSDGSRLVATGHGLLGEEEYPSTVIYVSANGGESWELSTSSPDILLTSVTSSADGMKIMAVGVTSLIGDEVNFIAVSSVDGGESWDIQVISTIAMDDMEEFGDDYLTFMALYLSRITASSDLSHIYVALFNKVIYSNNGGEDWEDMLPLSLSNESFVFPSSISASANGSTIMLAMSPMLMMGDPEMAVVIVSHDYGETWEPILSYLDQEVIPFSVMVSKDAERFFVIDAFARNMYISSDKGLSWATSTAPGDHSWIYVAPSATGEGVVAAVVENRMDAYDDELLWYRIVVYSSLDNGTSWTRQSESEDEYFDEGMESMFGQLVGGISGSYNLSRLGLVVFSELFVITQVEPTLPTEEEIVSPSQRTRRSSSHIVGQRPTQTVENLVNQHRDMLLRAHSMGISLPQNILDLLGITAPAFFVRDLKYGMEGADVVALQTLLIGQGHSIPAGATGLFLNQTRSALAAYQAANGISPAVGYFGPITRAQMKAAGLSGLWW